VSVDLSIVQPKESITIGLNVPKLQDKFINSFKDKIVRYLILTR